MDDTPRVGEPARRIVLRDVRSPPMRAFHVSWVSFFCCFFAWFGIAPLMAVVREDLGLTQEQVGNTIIASVAFTIVARVGMGRICDRFGPRRAYTGLMLLGALPVMGIGLSQSYETFLLFRLLIGGVGASFVVTQYHTTVMFHPSIVGAANATSAGWGNLGGGVTQFAMPLLLAGILALGFDESTGWRLAMVMPGLLLWVLAGVYWKATQDAPWGDWPDRPRNDGEGPSLWSVLNDHRVLFLFIVYGACFGVELTINNVAALYFLDRFDISIGAAGAAAATFGAMNIFARSLGGLVSDRLAADGGLKLRLYVLGVMLVAEGVLLGLFTRMDTLLLAIVAMMAFSVCVQMAEGATFAIVPFVNQRSVGTVVGVVAAGGNAGAVAAGFLFRIDGFAWSDALMVLAGVAVVSSIPVFLMAARYREGGHRNDLPPT